VSRILSSSLSDLGRKRANNEDFITSFEPTDPAEQEDSGSLYIVADGVGGAAFGERASQYAAEKVLYEYYLHPEIEVGERLRKIIEHVNEEIFSFANQSDSISRMGTTLVAAAILGDRLIVANVGDSRAYLIRGGEVTQITRDHNLVGELVHNGSMTEAEAITSKVKNRLTRALGSEEEVRVDIFSPIPLQPGDKLLLCTDGLTRYALSEDIASLTQARTPDEITHDLVDFANERGGADNVSVIVMAFEPAMGVWPVARVQKTPGPVSWDRIQTEPGAPMVRPVTALWSSIRKVHLPTAPMFWVLLGLFAVILIGVMVGRPKGANPSSEVTPSLNSLGTADQMPIATDTLDPTNGTASSAEFLTLTPGLLAIPVNTLSAITATSPSLSGKVTCNYIVIDNDAVSSIYHTLGLSSNPPYKGFSCITENKSACKSGDHIYDPNNENDFLQPTWILTIENVDPGNCELLPGIPITATYSPAKPTPAASTPAR